MKIDNQVADLTDRERDVLRGISMGLTNAQIAEQYTLSTATVKWYTRQIYSKLQLDYESDKRRAAATIGKQVGLVESNTPSFDLPADVTPFIGRADEIATLCALLRAQFPRLITIVGLGGTGKTRLAIQVACAIASHYDGRIHFVELQSAVTRNDLLRTIACAIGCATSGAQNWLNAIEKRLDNSYTLLVLDNVEQLIEAAPTFVELLERQPNLRLLATSRRPLNLNSEGIFPLTGLAYPCEDTNDNPLDFDAVKFFVRMARQTNLCWQPDAEDLWYIIRICEEVDGLPLALNLAARWFPRLSLETIADEVVSNNEHLVTEMSDISPRHRSVESVMRWLSNQLEAKDLKSLACLGLFNADFALDAIEHVAGMSDQTLKKFIQLGILEVEQPERFKLHPLVRQYALQKLEESGGYIQAVQRFVGHYVRMTVSLADQLIRDTTALDTLEHEWVHIRAAWKYAIELEDLHSLYALLVPLHHFAWRRNYFREATVLYELAYEAINPVEEFLKAEIKVRILHFSTWTSPVTPSMNQDLREQIAVLRTHHERNPEAFAQGILSLMLRVSGQYEEAYEVASHALEIYQDCNDSWGTVIALYQVGLALYQLNDTQKAYEYWQQCQEINTVVGDIMIASMVLHRMAGIKWRDGDSSQALKLLDNAHKMIKPLRDREMVGGIAQLTSLVYFSRGEFDAATRHREISLQYYHWVNDERTIRYLLTQQVYTALLRHRLSDAQTAMQEIGANLSEPTIATCADHLRYTVDEILPDPSNLLTRIEYMQNHRLNMEALLTSALLTANLVETERYRQVVLLSASLVQSSACPTWLLKLPVMQSSLNFAKHQLGHEQFQALWYGLHNSSYDNWLRLLLK